ncbi:hypothetical protein MmTuc01_2360 [Methanosarcina mazei Tuc01]|uniref:Uncharacterized protein n=1 Tax=Methanosarcina mazei Tuc01 TaxID=1236903 RepID=M1QBR1_METMZ|nr:hypothetical protein MmTuc01_2360 [Methanosarcina mazei Tuc01]
MFFDYLYAFYGQAIYDMRDGVQHYSVDLCLIKVYATGDCARQHQM